eukprot:GSA25T00024281001.1
MSDKASPSGPRCENPARLHSAEQPSQKREKVYLNRREGTQSRDNEGLCESQLLPADNDGNVKREQVVQVPR